MRVVVGGKLTNHAATRVESAVPLVELTLHIDSTFFKDLGRNKATVYSIHSTRPNFEPK
jgi:hypothetical protein